MGKTEQSPADKYPIARMVGGDDPLEITAEKFPVRMRLELVAPASHFADGALTFQQVKQEVDEISKLPNPWDEWSQWELEDSCMHLYVGEAQLEKPERQLVSDPDQGELVRLTLQAEGEIDNKAYAEFFALEKIPEEICLRDLKDAMAYLDYEDMRAFMSKMGLYDPKSLQVTVTEA